MQVSEVGLSTQAVSRIEKSIECHLVGDKPKVENGLCVFRFKPNTILTEENINQYKFKDEIWNLAINSNVVIFDLSNVNFIDDVVFGLLVGLNNLLKSNDIKLGFSCIQPEVLDSIEIKHLDRNFLIKETEEQLIHEFEKEISQIVRPRSFRDLRGLKELDEPTRAVHDARTTFFHKSKEPLKLVDVVSVNKEERIATISFPGEVSLRSDEDVSGLNHFTTVILGLVEDKPEVIINFENVKSIGNEVICGLLTLNKRRSMSICGLKSEPLSRLKTMKLDKILNIVEI